MTMKNYPIVELNIEDVCTKREVVQVALHKVASATLCTCEDVFTTLSLNTSTYTVSIL